MKALDLLTKRRNEIVKKLQSVSIPNDGSITSICWKIGNDLDVSGTTVRNYVQGDVKDGYLAEAIYSEFQRLNLAK
jgi:hypothetical protein